MHIIEKSMPLGIFNSSIQFDVIELERARVKKKRERENILIRGASQPAFRLRTNRVRVDIVVVVVSPCWALYACQQRIIRLVYCRMLRECIVCSTAWDRREREIEIWLEKMSVHSWGNQRRPNSNRKVGMNLKTLMNLFLQ